MRENAEAELIEEGVWKRCEVLVEEATIHATHFREQGAVLLRWSVTTCLTINVGALVATLNVADFDDRSRIWAGVWFLGGTLLALVVTATLASAFLKMANNLAQIAKDMKIALKLKDLPTIQDLTTTGITGGEARGGLAFLLSFLSVLSFLVGAGIMIEGAP